METQQNLLQDSILNWIQKKDNSVVKLSKLSGLSPATIRNTIKGRHSPNIKTTYRILSVTASSEIAMDYLKPRKPTKFTVNSADKLIQSFQDN